MSFFVDIVTEDSFYENMTLGVIKVLENLSCVKNVRIDRRNGCDRNAISNWEQRHCCTLPEDMKNFYASIDGFLLSWNLDISGEEFPIGRMEIGSLSSLKRFVNRRKERQSGSNAPEMIELDNETESIENKDGTVSVPLTSSRVCRLFEICQCSPGTGNEKVYLFYRSKNDQDSPGIWLHHEETNKWYHLANNFTKYFRTMLVHLGLPLWQCCVAGLPLPTWVEQIYFLVCPHLLPATLEPLESISTSLWKNGPTNVLDSSIFKAREIKQRNYRKK